MPKEEIVEYHMKVCYEYSKATRQKLKSQLNVPYGETKAKLDIFEPPSVANKGDDSHPPVMVFIHGGYWQECNKDMYSFVADSVTNAGCIAVVVGHTLAPEVDLDHMVWEIQTALEFIVTKFPKSKMYLSGYSSGAHLCTMMLTKCWSEDSLVPKAIQGMCLVSGLYDVVPLVNTYVNEALKLTEEDAKRNSPLSILKSTAPTITCPVIGVVTEGDSPEFVRQTEVLLEILKSYGLPSSFINLPGEDHFSVIENLVHPESSLFLVKTLIPNK